MRPGPRLNLRPNPRLRGVSTAPEAASEAPAETVAPEVSATDADAEVILFYYNLIKCLVTPLAHRSEVSLGNKHQNTPFYSFLFCDQFRLIGHFTTRVTHRILDGRSLNISLSYVSSG